MEQCVVGMVLMSLVSAAMAGQFMHSSDQAAREPHAHFLPSAVVPLKGGRFKMGVSDFRSKTGEYPVKHVQVRPFKVDRYPVTNSDFAQFKKEKKKYHTTSETSGFSYVFYTSTKPDDRLDVKRKMPSEPWWFPLHGATWFHPEGPHSDARSRPDHPVVHVSHNDARAFCHWAGKRLLTEHEWEFAARGGLAGVRYPWGDSFQRNRTNLWQGVFPMENYVGDGHAFVSPVNAFVPQNDFGMYDMVGNVWEWTATEYRHIQKGEDPNTAVKRERQYVVKGGSFIDSRDGRFNLEARCAARKGLPPLYTGQNVGFRCGQNYDPEAKKEEVTPAPTPAPTRQPRSHYIKETWQYRLGQAIKFVLLGDENDKMKSIHRKREDL